MRFSGDESEQNGLRPGVIFQNNVGNVHSPNIIALPLTKVLKKTSQPTHVVIKSFDSGLSMDSVVLCENPQRMAKSKIGRYITHLSDEYMAQIAVANLLATSAISFIHKDELIAAWESAIALNAIA